MKISIKSKITVFFILVYFVPLFFLTVYVFSALEKNGRSQFDEICRGYERTVSLLLSEYFSSLESELRFLPRLENNLLKGSASNGRFLLEAMRDSPSVEGVRIVYSSGAEETAGKIPETANPAYLYYSGTGHYFILSKALVKGARAEVLVNASGLTARLKRLEDESSSILVEGADNEPVYGALEAFPGKDPGIFSPGASQTGQKKAKFSLAPLKNNAFLHINRAGIFVEIKRLKSKIIVFDAIILLAGSVVSFLLGRRITVPVIRLKSGMERYAADGVPAEVFPSTGDELEDLAVSFRELVGKIEDSRKKIKDIARLSALGEMASIVGHELRNPLTAINNSVYYLDKKIGSTGDEALKLSLLIIKDEVISSDKIVQDLLNFSRTRPPNFGETEIRELIDEVVSRLKIRPEVKVSQAVDESIKLLLIDRQEFKQVLLNLIGNAEQAIEGPGKVEVRVFAVSSGCVIRISDTGCGISKDTLAKIFEPFFTTKSKGTGLGLAVVKRVVDRHQGLISAESSPGSGTTFTITLPAERMVENKK